MGCHREHFLFYIYKIGYIGVSKPLKIWRMYLFPQMENYEDSQTQCLSARRKSPGNLSH